MVEWIPFNLKESCKKYALSVNLLDASGCELPSGLWACRAVDPWVCPLSPDTHPDIWPSQEPDQRTSPSSSWSGHISRDTLEPTEKTLTTW